MNAPMRSPQTQARNDMHAGLMEVRTKFLIALDQRLDTLELLTDHLEDPSQRANALEAIKHEAHKIAGTAGTLGFQALGAEARAVEEAIIAVMHQGRHTHRHPILDAQIDDLLESASQCVLSAQG